MPQPNKIPLAFAASGDKNAIPESTETTGLASWREGFPAITSTPFSEGGIAPKRADFNGIFNALSLATLWQQQGGFYAYDATTDYEVGNVVEYSDDLYKCITANGPSSSVKAPTDTTVWSKVMTAADAAALYLPLAGGQMSGNITKNVLNGILYISGGQGWNLAANGARLALYGRDESTNPGAFFLGSGSAQGEKSLVGKPDGTLTWNNLPLVCGEFYSDHCKLNNNIEMECGYVDAAVGGNVVTFKRAFTVGSTPRVFVQPWVANAVENANVYSLSTTGFNFYSSRAIGVLYFAISLVE